MYRSIGHRASCSNTCSLSITKCRAVSVTDDSAGILSQFQTNRLKKLWRGGFSALRGIISLNNYFWRPKITARKLGLVVLMNEFFLLFWLNFSASGKHFPDMVKYINARSSTGLASLFNTVTLMSRLRILAIVVEQLKHNTCEERRILHTNHLW